MTFNSSIINYDISGLLITEYKTHNIFIIKNFFDKSDCDEIIDYLNNNENNEKLDFHNHNHVKCFSYNKQTIEQSLDEKIKKKI